MRLLTEDSVLVIPELLYVTHSVYEKDWSSIPHTHGFTEFILIDKGEGRLLMDNKEYSLKKGDFLIISPGLMHTETSSPDNCLGYYVLGVSNVRLDQIGGEVINTGLEFDVLYPIVEAIYKEALLKENGYLLMIESLLLKLIAILIRKNRKLLILKQTEKIPTHALRAKSYIDSHYGEDINLDDLAKKVNLSKFHLSREFKKETGLSPMAYLAQIRIKEAKALLSDTDYSVLSVSISSGFSSPSYFSQSFRHLTGMSPQEFRTFSKTKDRVKGL